MLKRGKLGGCMLPKKDDYSTGGWEKISKGVEGRGASPLFNSLDA
jgi:hypothetical protein